MTQSKINKSDLQNISADSANMVSMANLALFLEKKTPEHYTVVSKTSLLHIFKTFESLAELAKPIAAIKDRVLRMETDFNRDKTEILAISLKDVSRGE